MKTKRVEDWPRCKRCKRPTEPKDIWQGYCHGCIYDMQQEDAEEPDGGAYREHQA